jgi:hypothetical protein
VRESLVLGWEKATEESFLRHGVILSRAGCTPRSQYTHRCKTAHPFSVIQLHALCLFKKFWHPDNWGKFHIALDRTRIFWWIYFWEKRKKTLNLLFFFYCQLVILRTVLSVFGVPWRSVRRRMSRTIFLYHPYINICIYMYTYTHNCATLPGFTYVYSM